MGKLVYNRQNIGGGTGTIQLAIFPTASAENSGKIYQYIGETNANFTNGFFYKCSLKNSSYSWEALPVSEGGTASSVTYSNTTSGLTATNTQSAIDEINTKVNSIPDAVVPKGTVAFASLPSLASVEVGWMYNISDDFTTTSDFVTSGISEKAGSNVYCIEVSGTKKWDVFAVSDNVVVDQTYDATSTNPQSGTAVAQAITGLSGHYTISYSNGIATLTAV